MGLENPKGKSKSVKQAYRTIKEYLDELLIPKDVKRSLINLTRVKKE